MFRGGEVRGIILIFFLLVFAPWSLAIAGQSRVFWRPEGQALGDPSIPAYVGSSPVVAMTAYQGGVLTAFSNTGNGYRIHWSSSGEQLGGGEIRYDGSSPVTAMVPYQKGLLVAFSKAGGNGNRIWFSADGQQLGGGELRYDGSAPVTALAEYNGGVMAAFANAGGNGYRIWYSPDGRHLGAGKLVYDGSSPVIAMLPYHGGLLTAFARAGSGYRVHWSPDGSSPGGGAPVYDGSSPITAMTQYQDGVLVAFTHAGPAGNRIHWSPDGKSIGTGTPRYDGSTVVSAMLSFNGGVYTAFVGEGEGECDTFCSIAHVISSGAESVRKVGRDLDRIRIDFQNKLEADATLGPALEQWLKASRDTSIQGALPMPPEMRKALHGWYSNSLFDKVRFKAGDGGALNLANRIIKFGEADAVTLIDVIIFKGPSEAANPELWAHEMMHIKQFDEMGVHSFAVRYVRTKGHDLEDPAYAIQDQFRTSPYPK